MNYHITYNPSTLYVIHLSTGVKITNLPSLDFVWTMLYSLGCMSFEVLMNKKSPRRYS